MIEFQELGVRLLVCWPWNACLASSRRRTRAARFDSGLFNGHLLRRHAPEPMCLKLTQNITGSLEVSKGEKTVKGEKGIEGLETVDKEKRNCSYLYLSATVDHGRQWF